MSESGIPLWGTRGARAFHQFHSQATPPVHHVASVVRNAENFAAKWGERTMRHWLRAFRLMGLIEERSGRLRQLRPVTSEDIARFRPGAGQPYASSRRVLASLERAAQAAE